MEFGLGEVATAEILLKKGEGRLLKSGGLWVFDNEIAEIRGNCQNGGIVRVLDFDSFPMGLGLINEYS